MNLARTCESTVMPVTVNTPIASAVRRKAGPPTPPAGRQAPDLVMQIIKEAKKNPMTAEELAAENARLMSYGARQAQKAGIKERDIPRVIHESRSRHRTP